MTSIKNGMTLYVRDPEKNYAFVKIGYIVNWKKGFETLSILKGKHGFTAAGKTYEFPVSLLYALDETPYQPHNDEQREKMEGNK